jgi:preprotein translocase subunit SecF
MELIKPGSKIPFTRYRYIADRDLVGRQSVGSRLTFHQRASAGVDFAGGTVAQLKFAKPVSIPEIRNALGELGAGDTVIQDFGQEGSNEFLVRLQRTSVQLGELANRSRRDLPNSSAARVLKFAESSRWGRRSAPNYARKGLGR